MVSVWLERYVLRRHAMIELDFLVLRLGGRSCIGSMSAKKRVLVDDYIRLVDCGGDLRRR